MTIRFAAAINRRHPRLASAQACALPRRAANDNTASPMREAMLRAALRQFATHGIGAAAHARLQAEEAFFAGDRETYDWWLSICRTLDRRMAAAFSQEAKQTVCPETTDFRK